jgi:adenylate kinase
VCAAARLLFVRRWNNLIEKHGEENLSFPAQILWLAGAPGAGKGAMTRIIQEYRGITTQPIEVGAMLTSPAALALKAQGKLVGDQQVLELLLGNLLRVRHRRHRRRIPAHDATGRVHQAAVRSPDVAAIEVCRE